MLLLLWDGDRVDGIGRLRSLGLLRCLCRIQAGFSVGGKLDSMHIDGVVMENGNRTVDGNESMMVRRSVEPVCRG